MKAAPAKTDTRSPFWSGFGVIFVCFFLSGATGLVYQVLWLRLLGLVFGHTVYAITTVLAAFMAGLALGSYLFARLAPRIRRLILAYGLLEIGIGVCCALIPLLLKVASVLYLGAHRTFGFSYDAFSVIQFLLVFAVLLIPTTLMGGTLPVLSQAIVTDQRGLGRKIGALYAINTFGAVLGVLLAGYFLLPAIGNRATIAVAALANFGVGSLAIVYSRRRPPAAAQRAESASHGGAEAPVPAKRSARHTGSARSAKPDRDRAPSTSDLGVVCTVLALGVSGAASMVYEVSWTRALALVIGSSTYAFSAMLVAFLVGIAGGSALYSWIWGARRASPATFAAIQGAIGALVLATLLFFERMPELFLRTLSWSASPGVVISFQIILSAAALLSFTLFIGATFPCAVAVAVKAVSRVGRDVGHVYAVNTVGSIVGSVATGFLLIPALGVHGAIRAGIAVNWITAAVLLVMGVRPVSARRWAWAGAALAASAALALVPRWNPSVMSAGPAIYGKQYLESSGQRSFKEILRSQNVVFYRDGVSGTVSIVREGQDVFLKVNGKIDAGTAQDMPTQLMSGHIPMLLHPGPKSVLIIGMGSGVTAGAVAKHPVERVDLVEIEPAVVEASRFFAHVHGDVTRDPRVRVIIADGRNYLHTIEERYDAIISEPSNPWIGGLASLFSVEFFRTARDRLNPGGCMLQWLQGYNILPDDFRMVVNTFRSVFPAVTIWNTISGDFLLLGRMEPVPFDLDLLRARCERNPVLRSELESIGIRSWPGVLGYFMLNEPDVVQLTAGAGLNTDDRLPLEFSTPRALYLMTAAENWHLVRGAQTSSHPTVSASSRHYLKLPAIEYGIGLGYASRNMSSDALVHFQHALELDPANVPSLLWASLMQYRLKQFVPALELARRALSLDPTNAEASYFAGLASEELGAIGEARAALERAVELAPRNEEYRAALERVRSR